MSKLDKNGIHAGLQTPAMKRHRREIARAEREGKCVCDLPNPINAQYGPKCYKCDKDQRRNEER